MCCTRAQRRTARRVRGGCYTFGIAPPHRRWRVTAKVAGLDTFVSNLPLALTSFVGRETELGEIARLVHDHRLVTLTGAGGIGKTQTALQVGTALSETAGTAVCFVALAPVGDPALVVAAIASTLSVQEVPDRPLLETLMAYLKNKSAPADPRQLRARHYGGCNRCRRAVSRLSKVRDPRDEPRTASNRGRAHLPITVIERPDAGDSSAAQRSGGALIWGDRSSLAIARAPSTIASRSPTRTRLPSRGSAGT